MQPNVSAKRISDILSTPLIVPDYQRPYSWEAAQVDEFINDTISFVKKHPDNTIDDYYLFGQIIVHVVPGKANIVDGQQRLVTSTIFLCAIRDLYDSDHDTFKISKITRSAIDNCIGIYDPENNESSLKLKVSNKNQGFFLKYIQQGNHNFEPESESDELIKQAYELIVEKLKDAKNEGLDLNHIAKGFLDCFYVSYMETNDLRKAFLIFETLNSRGQPLGVQDLLKSHFFSILDKSNDHMKNEWTNMVNKIENAKGDVAKYIRHYWNSYHKHTREKELFSEISELNNSDSILFLEGLFKNTEKYVSMINFKINGCYNAEIKDILKNLRDVGASSFYPLIFAVHRTNNDDRLLELLKTIESLIFRNQVIMKKTANTNEVFFCDQAFNLSSAKISVDEVIKNIINKTEDDSTIESSFMKFSPNSTVARTILFDLFKYENPGVSLVEYKVHLEHIMPQTKGLWDVDEEVWKIYNKRFGNMTLLYGIDNSKIKNKPYTEKRKIAYLDSKIPETKQIALDHEYDWTSEDIDSRQSELFKRFITRWKSNKKPDSKQSTII